MRQLIVLVTVICVVGGVGPVAELAFADHHSPHAERQPVTPLLPSAQAPCMTLPQLSHLRQELAQRALESTDPVAVYRAELDKAALALAAQPYECIAGLRTAILAEGRGTRLVRLDFEGPISVEPVNTDWNLGLDPDASQIGIEACGLCAELVFSGALAALGGKVLDWVNRTPKNQVVDFISRVLGVSAATAGAIAAALNLSGHCDSCGHGSGGGGNQGRDPGDREK